MNKDTPRHLRYASGYLELGMVDEASAELERIAFGDQLQLPVLAVRIELHMTAKHWDSVVGLGRTLTQQTPENERGWICWAYALREQQQIAEAKAVLLKAEPLHGGTSAVLHYNLACYDCLLGDLSEAKRRLATACRMEKSFEAAALDDPDLALSAQTPRRPAFGATLASDGLGVGESPASGGRELGLRDGCNPETLTRSATRRAENIGKTGPRKPGVDRWKRARDIPRSSFYGGHSSVG